MKLRLSRAGQAICMLAILAVFTDAVTAQQGRRSREDGDRDDRAPNVGDTAPLFKLKTLEGNQEVDLAEVIKSKPVVLFFGSNT